MRNRYRLPLRALVAVAALLPLAACIEIGPTGTPRLDVEGDVVRRWVAADPTGAAAQTVRHWTHHAPEVLDPGRRVFTPDVLAALEAHVADLESRLRWDLRRWDTWMAVADCESNGNWHIDTGNGYKGGLQFDQDSWERAGGSGNPAHASVEEQVRRANRWLDLTGWRSWPTCARRLGLL